MNNKEVFKLGLYLNDEPIMEQIFDADVYQTKGNVNIMDKANYFIGGFKKVLRSSNNYLETTYKSNDTTIDLVKEYENSLQYTKINKNNNKLVRLDTGNIVVTDKAEYYENKNEQFKYILFIVKNNEEKHIIERNFFVKNYVPKSRFSLNLKRYFDYVVESIKESIKENDCKEMWYEYDKSGLAYVNI